MTVNGMKVPDWSSFMEARARNDDHMTVELIRDGVMVRLEVELQHSAAPPLEPPSLLADIIGRDVVQLDALLGLKKTEKN